MEVNQKETGVLDKRPASVKSKCSMKNADLLRTSGRAKFRKCFVRPRGNLPSCYFVDIWKTNNRLLLLASFGSVASVSGFCFVRGTTTHFKMNQRTHSWPEPGQKKSRRHRLMNSKAISREQRQDRQARCKM